jgi:hypothetical protein
LIDGLILFVVALCYWAYRRLGARRRGAGKTGRAAADFRPLPSGGAPSELPAAPTADELRPLSAWAFDYERLVLETDATVAQRDHAFHILSRLIVPLVGHVRLCDVDDELVPSVRRVLAAQLQGAEAAYAGRLWTHFVGWSRYYAAPPSRRNIWLMLDPDVERVYDEFSDR